ncbi:MAG: hypothetical protein PHS44_08110 [Candidatus Dojkabacteria bacterium]|nr:hypothetical protein [Candidatus Dojkabacteria bacterium]
MNKLIKELVYQKADKKEIFMSLYLPYSKEQRNQYVTKLKSLIYEGFRRSSLFENSESVHERIFNEIKPLLLKQVNLKKGLAVFLKFDTNKQEKFAKNREKLEYLKVIFLDRRVKKQIVLSRIFDLAQLSDQENFEGEALIIRMDREDCSGFKLSNNKLHKLFELDSDYEVIKEKEYMEKYSPIADQKESGLYKGTGESNLDRRRETYVRWFTDKVVGYISDKINLKNYSALIVFHSENVRENVDLFDDLRSFNHDLAILKIARNIQEISDLRAESIDSMKRIVKNIKKKLLEKARERNNDFVSGLNEVTRAVRQERVKRLFMNSLKCKKGYLLESSGKVLPYSYPVRDSKLTECVNPWIVREVLHKGGQVIIAGDSGNMWRSDLASELRY